MQEITNLKDKFIIGRWLHSVGNSIMTDEEYDAITNFMKAMYSNDPVIKPYLERTWQDDQRPTELLNKYHIDDGVTQNVEFYTRGESVDSVTDKTVLDSICKKFPGQLIMATPKINGWSVRVSFVNGELQDIKSRARENNDNMDFNQLKPYYKKLVDKDKIGNFTGVIIGEAYLTHINFRHLKYRLKEKRLKSQVASVIAAIKSAPDLISTLFFNIDEQDVQYANKFEKYDRLNELGFETPPSLKFIADHYNFVLPGIKRDFYDYLTDGIVLDFPDSSIKAIRLYDYKSTLYTSTVVGLEESFNAKNIGIKLLIEPVETREGSTQTRIDIDNLGRIKEYGLTEGAYVVFEKVSDTIEKIHPMTKQLNLKEGDM